MTNEHVWHRPIWISRCPFSLRRPFQVRSLNVRPEPRSQPENLINFQSTAAQPEWINHFLFLILLYFVVQTQSGVYGFQHQCKPSNNMVIYGFAVNYGLLLHGFFLSFYDAVSIEQYFIDAKWVVISIGSKDWNRNHAKRLSESSTKKWYDRSLFGGMEIFQAHDGSELFSLFVYNVYLLIAVFEITISEFCMPCSNHETAITLNRKQNQKRDANRGRH